MRSFYVTAIGTEIGKTYVSSLLLKRWRAAGKSVHALKPVMSGFGEVDLAESDAGQLLAASGCQVTPQAVSEICFQRFEAPLAPNVAMRQTGVSQDYDAILEFTRQRLCASTADVALVEGAGGVMSPLTDEKLQIDFMVDLALPVILVAAPYLGAVSHSLTAIDMLAKYGLELHSLIISQPNAEDGTPESLGSEIALFRKVNWSSVPYGSNEILVYQI
ncbi:MULTISPECIES: dethiobiotin synthase [Henriciella]|jgi:dethiobiotin synthetase|uniref:ATP-dependent dethiobiotin synthetase BioD n=1 Tax=Henriciella pelagia TaxID=1977912 RepID=A0ABQ1J5A4_9PROT|nr:dethiobiotin synthase [Henriciella pelagia]GGB59071.1 ATP-dependent dethiobiotin synthetase BioD [Henriciella pelagia]